VTYDTIRRKPTRPRNSDYQRKPITSVRILSNKDLNPDHLIRIVVSKETKSLKKRSKGQGLRYRLTKAEPLPHVPKRLSCKKRTSDKPQDPKVANNSGLSSSEVRNPNEDTTYKPWREKLKDASVPGKSRTTTNYITEDGGKWNTPPPHSSPLSLHIDGSYYYGEEKVK
jgi:hypothetical protein